MELETFDAISARLSAMTKEAKNSVTRENILRIRQTLEFVQSYVTNNIPSYEGTYGSQEIVDMLRDISVALTYVGLRENTMIRKSQKGTLEGYGYIL